jgi:sugar phosphate isomerase/epimerase
MKLGIFTALFSDLTLDDVIRRVCPLGIEAVELATGNYGKPAHVHLDWIDQPDRLRELRDKLNDAGLVISALGCGGNVLHPNPEIGPLHAETNRRTILLAEKLGVSTVIDFSGCPGDSEKLPVSELRHRRMASRLSGDSEVAVGRENHSFLA